MEQRPAFASLLTRLSQPDWSLNKWSRVDTQSHPQAGVLGAPLIAGHQMYNELQSMYL